MTKWTEKEVKILEQYYPTEGSKIINRLPGRSLQSIQGKASRLNIKVYVPISSWTEKEVKILEQYYPTEGSKIIHRLTNRTIGAIQRKANYLGIQFNFEDRWSTEDDAILTEKYPYIGPDIPMRNRTRSAIHVRAQKLNLLFEQSKKHLNTTKVYLIYFSSLDLYKIGITCDIFTRLKSFGTKPILIYHVDTEDYTSAKILEKELLSKVTKINTNLLNSGNTETFKASQEEILELGKYFS